MKFSSLLIFTVIIVVAVLGMSMLKLGSSGLEGLTDAPTTTPVQTGGPTTTPVRTAGPTTTPVQTPGTISQGTFCNGTVIVKWWGSTNPNDTPPSDSTTVGGWNKVDINKATYHALTAETCSVPTTPYQTGPTTTPLKTGPTGTPVQTTNPNRTTLPKKNTNNFGLGYDLSPEELAFVEGEIVGAEVGGVVCASDPFLQTSNQISQVFQTSFVGMMTPIMQRVMDNISNTVLNSIGTSSNDYMLKNQVVPPIYPYQESCSQCGNGTGGICSNCGGQGGNGMAGLPGSYSINKNGQIVGSGGATNVPQNNTGFGGVVNNTVDTAGNVVNTALGTAGGALNTVGNTVGGLANTAGGIADSAIGSATVLGMGAEGIAGSVVDKAGNILDKAGNIIGNVADKSLDLVGGAGSGLYNLAKDAENGAFSGAADPTGKTYDNAGTLGNILGSPAKTIGGVPGQGPTPIGGAANRGSGPQPTQVLAGNDINSAFGALVQKGGNFMPLTADFSAFT